ncbi:hypothetical protein LR48_Vigan02g131100 [Vigna angularis]|uniref:Uncharacterized protein n=1 Tax=Phaseolus angularis TaxID=3914 RepID=A0A0L9TXC8_PHAAN|nr:hypothetical protein LR48_Vigan02g131100 [Vigna angularis]
MVFFFSIRVFCHIGELGRGGLGFQAGLFRLRWGSRATMVVRVAIVSSGEDATPSSMGNIFRCQRRNNFAREWQRLKCVCEIWCFAPIGLLETIGVALRHDSATSRWSSLSRWQRHNQWWRVRWFRLGSLNTSSSNSERGNTSSPTTNYHTTANRKHSNRKPKQQQQKRKEDKQEEQLYCVHSGGEQLYAM